MEKKRSTCARSSISEIASAKGGAIPPFDWANRDEAADVRYAGDTRCTFFLSLEESVRALIVMTHRIEKTICIRFRQEIDARSAFATAA